jgi:hypothetical protein
VDEQEGIEDLIRGLDRTHIRKKAPLRRRSRAWRAI